MTITIDENFIALWYILLSDSSDFMAGLTRNLSGTLECTYRFRYYKDDKTGLDSDDEKHWYSFSIDPEKTTKDDALITCRNVFGKLADLVKMHYPDAKLVEIVMGPDGLEGVLRKMGCNPCFHIAKLPPSEQRN